MYSQADIVVVKFPFTNGIEFKKRPALIISNSLVNKTGDYLVVQITSKSNDGLFSILINDKDIVTPLQLVSYLRIHKIFTLHESLILSKITEVRPEFFKLVKQEICNLIDYQILE